jgi:hypothetical protein
MWRENPLRRAMQAFAGSGQGQIRLHGGALGSGAPKGERNGNWKGGRYSRVVTPEQRRQSWQDYWTARRVQRGAITADILDALDLEIPAWFQS